MENDYKHSFDFPIIITTDSYRIFNTLFIVFFCVCSLRLHYNAIYLDFVKGKYYNHIKSEFVLMLSK